MRAAIVNPASASGKTATRWRPIIAKLEADGDPVEVTLTRGPGDAIEVARRLVGDGFRELIVLGGDGTLGEVVAGCIRPDGGGMLRDDVVLSVIHQGTGGDLARGLEIPKDEDGAIRVALGSTTRRIDVGVATYTPDPDIDAAADPGAGGRRIRGFVSTSNVGMAAEVVQQVTGRLKKLGDSASFAIASVNCMARNRARPVRIEVGDDMQSTLDVVGIDVCNNRYMGGGMLAAPGAKLDDGKFDVVIVSAASRFKLIRTFPKIYKGTHVDDPLVRVEQTPSLTVDVPDGADPQGVVLDGELVGTTPVEYRVIPGAISVRVPAR